MAELAKLLGFMSAWDRREALMKYDALFENAADEAELIADLGSPTKLAIGLALNYVPSPPPTVLIEENHEPDGSVGEFAASAAAEERPVPLSPAEEAAEEEDAPAPTEASPEADTAAETVELSAAALPKRKIRAFGLIGSILFGLIIGLPIALVLICIGIPFIALGGGVVGLTVWSAMSTIGLLTMFSDVLVIVGAALVLCALGLLLVWLGLWLSFELGYLWISGVVLRLGRALTYKKEVAAE